MLYSCAKMSVNMKYLSYNTRKLAVVCVCVRVCVCVYIYIYIQMHTHIQNVFVAIILTHTHTHTLSNQLRIPTDTNEKVVQRNKHQFHVALKIDNKRSEMCTVRF